METRIQPLLSILCSELRQIFIHSGEMISVCHLLGEEHCPQRLNSDSISVQLCLWLYVAIFAIIHHIVVGNLNFDGVGSIGFGGASSITLSFARS